MNRQNFYNGLLVSKGEMELLQDNIENADKEIQKLIGSGILSGLNVTSSEIPDRNIKISSGTAIYSDGSRAVMKNDVILDISPYIPTGAIPNTHKRYILITIKVGRNEYDSRNDADELSVNYRRDEGYTLSIYQSDTIETPSRLSIPVGEYALADILLTKDIFIVNNSDIDQTRQVFFSPIINRDVISAFYNFSTGKIKEAALPALSILNVFPVVSATEMLALNPLDCQTGDIAIRSDTGETYILKSSDPSVLENWILLKTVASNSDKLGGKTESQLVVADTAKAFGFSLTQLRDYLFPIGFGFTQFPSSTGFATRLPGDTLLDFYGNPMTFSQFQYANQSAFDTAKINCMWPGTTWKLAIKPANFKRQSLTRLDNNNKTIGGQFGNEQEHQLQGFKIQYEKTNFPGSYTRNIAGGGDLGLDLIDILPTNDGTNGNVNKGVETRPSTTCVFEWVRVA